MAALPSPRVLPYPYSGVFFGYTLPLVVSALKESLLKYVAETFQSVDLSNHWVYIYPSTRPENKIHNELLNFSKIFQASTHEIGLENPLMRSFTVEEKQKFIHIHPGDPYRQWKWMWNEKPIETKMNYEVVTREPFYITHPNYNNPLKRYPIDNENFLILLTLDFISPAISSAAAAAAPSKRGEYEEGKWYYCGDLQLAWEMAAVETHDAGSFKRCQGQYLNDFRNIYRKLIPREEHEGGEIWERKEEKEEKGIEKCEGNLLDEDINDVFALMNLSPTKSIELETRSLQKLLTNRIDELRKLKNDLEIQTGKSSADEKTLKSQIDALNKQLKTAIDERKSLIEQLQKESAALLKLSTVTLRPSAPLVAERIVQQFPGTRLLPSLPAPLAPLSLEPPREVQVGTPLSGAGPIPPSFVALPAAAAAAFTPASSAPVPAQQTEDIPPELRVSAAAAAASGRIYIHK